jgi:putative zinc finger protein
MSRHGCTAPIPRPTQLAYWLGELDEAAEAQLDEHLLGCDSCAGQLQALVELGDGIRRLVQRGRLRAVVSGALPKRLAEAGLRVREYHVTRNGSVHCTIAPDDDVVLAHLEAPLADVRQLDVLLFYPQGQGQERLEHVPFNASASAVVVVPGTDLLRALPASTMRMQLVAVEHGSDRLIGEYTFHHTPWAQLQQS